MISGRNLRPLVVAASAAVVAHAMATVRCSTMAVPSADEIGAELVRSRAERLALGLRSRVKDDAEALHSWLSSRSGVSS